MPPTNAPNKRHDELEVSPSLWRPYKEDIHESSRPRNGGAFSTASSVRFDTLHNFQHDAETTASAINTVQLKHKHKTQNNSDMLDDSLNRVTRRCDRLTRTRDRMLELRTQIQTEWARYADMQRFYIESQDNFMAQAELYMTSSDLTDHMTRLRHLHQQTRADLNAMEVQAEITRNLENRLSSMHFKIQQRDQAFVESCHALVDLLQRRSATTHREVPQKKRPASTATQSSRPSKTDAMHPLLEKHYDKAGDVGLIGEELANMDVEHEEGVEGRLLLAERDEDLSVSNSQFEWNYRSSRAEIEQRLEFALRVAQELKQ